MTTILSAILFVIFTLLALIHFYWLFGGKWGLEKVIPTKKAEKSTVSVPKIATLLVALILTLFGLIYFVKSGFFTIQVPNWVSSYVYWVIPSVFILRAIGEFKYVGFFKKIKDTEFAKADSRWFSPFCLMIGVIGMVIQFMSKQLIMYFI